MPTSPTDIMMISGGSWTDFESFDDALEAIKGYRESELDILQDIGERKRDRALVRFYIGEVVAHLQEKADYGDNIMGRVTEQVGVSKSYLRESRQFYDAHDGSEQACRSWMDEVEREKKQVNWGYCRRWARKQLSGEDYDEDQDKVEDIKRRYERRAERLEQDTREAEEQVMRANADEEAKAEALGALAHARQVAEDTRRQIERLELNEYERVESEKWRKVVTLVQCFACGKVGSREGMHPHHLERGGEGTKGPDTEAGALCSTCHNKLHNMPEEEFWEQMDVNPWKKLCQEVLSPALQHFDLDELADQLEPYFRKRNP